MFGEEYALGENGVNADSEGFYFGYIEIPTAYGVPLQKVNKS